MRIAMYTDSFFPYVSGVSTAVTILANALADAGHEIYIQAPRPKEAADLSFLHPRIVVKYVSSIDVVIYPDFRLGTRLPLFMNDIKDFAPDLIHVHTPLSVGLEGVLVSKRLKVPLVQTFHTYFMDKDALKNLGIRNEQLATLIAKGGWRFNRVLSGLCDATIAPTRYVAEDLMRHRTPGPVYICPNMLAEDVYAKQPRRNHKAKTLLFVGRLSPEKRINLLIEAYAAAREKIPDLDLAIIGDGPERQRLFDLSLSLGISNGIRWYGKIQHQDLIGQRFYHEGDVFVTLSRFETYGYTTLEAMAHQLPVIALASKANTEVVGKAGFLVPDTTDEKKAVDAIAKKIVLVCGKDLSELRQRAYEQAMEYHPHNLLPLYEQIYEDAINHYAEKENKEEA